MEAIMNKLEFRVIVELSEDAYDNGYTKDAIIKQISRQITIAPEAPVQDFDVTYIKEVK